MAIEDFASYTEVDTVNDRIQVTQSHIDHLAYLNEDTYVYKNKGVGHFGSNLEHLVDIRFVSFSAGTPRAYMWVLSNTVDDPRGIDLASGDYIAVAAVYNNRIMLEECDGGTTHSDLFTGTANTWYYLRIKKVGTALTCKIYDTAASRDAETADAHLKDTLNLTLQHDYSFQYVFACSSYNWSKDEYVENDIDNLDLQEGAPPAGQQLFTLINQEDY